MHVISFVFQLYLCDILMLINCFLAGAVVFGMGIKGVDVTRKCKGIGREHKTERII